MDQGDTGGLPTSASKRRNDTFTRRAERRVTAWVGSARMRQSAKHDGEDDENSEPGSDRTQVAHDLLLQFNRQTIAGRRCCGHPMFMGTQNAVGLAPFDSERRNNPRVRLVASSRTLHAPAGFGLPK
jgi:hypothetical protein